MGTHARTAAFVAVLGACSEYSLSGKKDVGEPTRDTGTECPPEIPDCHETGGEVETGEPGETGLGDCEVSVASATSVAILEECAGSGGTPPTEVTDPWNVRIQWQVTAPSTDASARSSYALPVIGNLDDDNGDGVIDEDDVPEVLVNMFGSQCHTVALDGSDGSEVWVWDGCLMTAGVIVADVDADGSPDVVTYEASGRVAALEGDGSPKWRSSQSPTSTSYPLVTVADLDEDGVPEVIADDLVLDGATGATEFSLAASVSNPYRIAAVADVDLDGDQEIFMTGTAYDSDGTVLWATGETGTYGFWPIIIQADGDAEAEIGFVGRNWTLWEHDGTPIYSEVYNSVAQPGPPCAGDFDGDGEAEVAWPAYQNFVMYELDGTQVWSVTMDDTSGLAGCSGYDVNADGALEILFADQSSFTIFDGATGAANYRNTNHRSGTVFEYPSVADIDHDGNAEIVIVSNYWSGSWGVVTAFEHAGDGWPASGSTWATHDFAITNIEPDGSVPRNPDPSWLVYNVYRARVAADDPAVPDLQVGLHDMCVVDCDDGPVKISFQVSNQGGADVDAGTSWAFFRNDGGAVALVTTGTLGAVAAGEAPEGFVVEVALQDIGADGFLLVVDDDGTGTGTVAECDEDNNTYVFADPICG